MRFEQANGCLKVEVRTACGSGRAFLPGTVVYQDGPPATAGGSDKDRRDQSVNLLATILQLPKHQILQKSMMCRERGNAEAD